MNQIVKTSASKTVGDAKDSSLCFVIDPEAIFRTEFSSRLRDAGVEIFEFSNSARLLESLDGLTPDVIFIHLNANDPFDCTRALTSLAHSSFGGRVQLIGRCESTFFESIQKLGQHLSLTILPPMKKPVNFSEVRKLIRQQKLVREAVATGDMTLSDALARNWIEFWYQPKVDLRNKTIVGAESLLRLIHPMHGVIPPGNFLIGSREDELQELAKRAVAQGLKASANFERQGIPIAIAVNMSIESLLSLPVEELVRKHGPQSDHGQGLVIEVPERQVISRTNMLQAKLPEISKCGISLALDHCGRGNSSFQMLNQFQFAEIKIDSSFVRNCDKDEARANVCKTIVQMAHNFSAKATAVGIETPAEAQKLTMFGCDLTQGFLYGKPMTEQKLVDMVMASRNVAKAAGDR
jgi:EAL domain-containing protein (putative c-di-GMP-specific phosphodiesterase class I)